MAFRTRSSLPLLFVDKSVLEPCLVFIVRRIAARYIEGESVTARDTVLRIRFFLPPDDFVRITIGCRAQGLAQKGGASSLSCFGSLCTEQVGELNEQCCTQAADCLRIGAAERALEFMNRRLIAPDRRGKITLAEPCRLSAGPQPWQMEPTAVGVPPEPLDCLDLPAPFVLSLFLDHQVLSFGLVSGP